MDINLLLDPRGSESPGSKHSLASVTSHLIFPCAISSPCDYTPSYPTRASISTPAMSSAMLGEYIFPALPGLQQDPDRSFDPLYTGTPGSAPARHDSVGANRSPPRQVIKQQASKTPLADESPAKKQSKWTPEEDNLVIELRGQGMKWDDIAKRLPGRSSISCRLRYQNYLEKRAIWDEEKKNKLAKLYARYILNAYLPTLRMPTNVPRFKNQMWQRVATEMGVPWRSAESIHWQLGEQEMSARANAPVFQPHPSATLSGSPPQNTAISAQVTFDDLTPASAVQLISTLPPASTQQDQENLPPQQQVSIRPWHSETDS